MAEYIERERAKEHLIGDYAYAAAKLLDDIPAADVVEVVHGEWKKTMPPAWCDDYFDTAYQCSICGYTNVVESNYCPGCGAKMAGSDINVTTNNGWISVKDRLPDNPMERVLVHIKEANGIMGLPNIDTDRYLEGDWVRWIENVTHWQPLPEPPKGGADNG